MKEIPSPELLIEIQIFNLKIYVTPPPNVMSDTEVFKNKNKIFHPLQNTMLKHYVLCHLAH